MNRFLHTLLLLAVSSSLPAQVVVLNGASFRTDQPLAPGSWATAFGAFGGVTSATAPGYPLPATLGGVSVSVDGADAPLYYVSSTQINFLIPYRTAAGVRPVAVKTAAATQTGTVRVMTAAPGLFAKETANQTPPKGAILNQDYSENTENAPIRRGEVIQIFATGPGALKTAVDDGTAAPGTTLVETVSTPQVYIGGVEATVQFSGLAPGFAGLWQINAFVPDRLFLNGRVPVQLGPGRHFFTIFVHGRSGFQRGQHLCRSVSFS